MKIEPSPPPSPETQLDGRMRRVFFTKDCELATGERTRDISEQCIGGLYISPNTASTTMATGYGLRAVVVKGYGEPTILSLL